VRDEWGRLDLLVNNAGTFGPSGEVDEIAVGDWRATVEVNLTGMFLCTRAAVRLMKAQDPPGGRIINNGSISAHVPRPGSVSYTATRNAATEMTAGIATGARQADGSVRPEATFDPAHVAATVVHIARLPLDVSVPSATVLATGMPYLGRG
jgi:NADP-dependent 3-hydroxy acid dehydrogenase YdfG